MKYSNNFNQPLDSQISTPARLISVTLLGRHRPAQLHGSVRQRAGGADESGGNPVESRAFEWAPLSVSRRRSRGLRKTPQWSAERRAGPRYGPAIPSADGRGHAVRQANGCGVPRPRISALRFPLLGVRRVRNRQFGTTARRDAPRGNAPARLNTCMEKITMLKFLQITLHRHARACRGHPRLGTKVRRGWPGQARP